MFTESGVTSTWKWEDFQRIMKYDDRFNIIKTIGQKKQIFLEHLQSLRKKDREDGKQRKQTARENFLKMLESSGILRAESKYYKTAHFFHGDPRWRILEEREREELFQDFLDELERKEKEKAKQTRNSQMAGLRKALEDNHDIDHRTKWLNVQKMMADNQFYKALHKIDQLSVFSDFVVDFERNSYESKKLDEKIKARKNRENFRKFLNFMVKNGSIGPLTHWREVYHLIQLDPSYQSLVGQAGSTPKEIFDDVIADAKSKFKDFKEVLMIGLANFEFSESTKYEDIYPICKDILEGIPEDARQTVFQIVYDEQRLLIKNSERKVKKHQKAFKDFLKSNPVVAESKTFEEIRQEITFKAKLFKRLSEDYMVAAFENYLKEMSLEDKRSDIEPGEIDSGKKEKKSKKDKKHKKKHKKHRSHEKSHKKKHKRSSRSPVTFI
jgi:pre-mRNA-processing factor 40